MAKSTLITWVMYNGEGDSVVFEGQQGEDALKRWRHVYSHSLDRVKTFTLMTKEDK